MTTIGQYQPGEGCGAHFINYENGVKPEIANGVGISGVIDCIHKVIIKEHAFSGHDVMILSGGHDYTKFGEERKEVGGGGPITIHEGVWIGSRAIILGPCEIGKNTVIGAGCVVKGKVPEYVVMIGNPARVLKIIPH